MGIPSRRAVATLVGLGALALAGCRPEILPEQDRVSEIDAVSVTVRIDADGTAHVAQRYTFASDDGGTVGLPGGLAGVFVDGVSNVAVDGVPVTPTGGTFSSQVPIPKREGTLAFDVTGVVERYADVAVLELDVLAPPEDTSRQDPNVDLSGQLVLPEGPPGLVEAHLHGARDALVTVEGSTVRFSGDAPIWNPQHDLAVAFPPDRVPFVPVTPIPFLDPFRTTQQVRDAADASLDSTLQGLDEGVEIGRWVVTGLAFGIPGIAWLAVGLGVLRRTRERKRMIGVVPEHITEPPTAVDPAIVAVLDGEGRPDRRAVAGTVLAMAERKAVDLQQYGDKLVIRVPLETTPTNESERLVLDALRSRGSTDGRVEGPPIFDGAPWWRGFRRDAVIRAREQGLVTRWLPIGTLSGAIVATAIGVAIFFFTQPGIFVGVVIGAQLLSVVGSFLGGWTLTTRGWRQRALWLAFGRYIDDHGKLDRDVGPEGVRVWGPYLTYGAVLGEAPGAARPLTP